VVRRVQHEICGYLWKAGDVSAGNCGAFFPNPTCQDWRGVVGCVDPTLIDVAARTAQTHPSGEQGELDLQQLAQTHYDPLYRFAMSLTRTEHNAADLVQDTFLILASKGHQLLDRSKVKSWLFTTLHRRFLEGHRRSTRFPHFELSTVESELPNCDPELVNQLDAPKVVELLAQIDPQYRAAVALFYLEDYAYQEIASILEIPLGTVKSRIARGLAQLKRLVADGKPAEPRREL
jgi:RNA polymerase sigma factor (sigma-70 family)